MTPRWEGRPDLIYPPPGLRGWFRIALRGTLLVLANFVPLLVLLLVRLVEAPICRARRPVTPWITVVVCRLSLAILGIKRTVQGQPMTGPGAGVSNHVSWLDIYALNAGHPLYFIAKAEVAGWPGIGWLARATGTLFIRRNRAEADSHVATLQQRLADGHRLMFFPEGTSTDGQHVLPFRSSLFAAFVDGPGVQWLQPVTLVWQAPTGQDAAFFGWWGAMGFAGSLRAVLAYGSGGRVTVIYHAAVPATGDRKVLARTLESAVRSGLLA